MKFMGSSFKEETMQMFLLSCILENVHQVLL
jgi:hypothetical protein